MNDVIRKSIQIDAPPERVWPHLTEPDRIAGWLMPNTFRAEVGAEFTMRCPPVEGSSGVVECTVEELVPARRLAYTWRIDVPAVETRVVIELIPEGGGTRVELEHSGWAALDDSDRPVRDRHEHGWDHLLAHGLRAAVEGELPTPFRP